MNARKPPVDLLFVIAPHSLLLDIAGPAEAFRLANLQLTLRKQPAHFRLRFAGPPAYETDGEWNRAASSDLTIGTRPAALRVLVPAPA